MIIKDINPDFYESILKLNNDNIPAVSELDIEKLAFIVNESKYAWMISDSIDHSLIGFCLILQKGSSYKSDNYKWVSENYESFDYLDRVVISGEHQNKGYGRLLYEQWLSKTGSKDLLLEVNIKPMNENLVT